jgi:hypothetical protein
MFATVIGLVFFAAGFLLTISSLSKTYAIGTDEASSGSLLDDQKHAYPTGAITMIGLLMSLAGIVVATVGPALEAFHRSS